MKNKVYVFLIKAIFAIPLAAGVLYGAGIIISPAIGAILMSLSTVIVAINAKMLKIKREI